VEAADAAAVADEASTGSGYGLWSKYPTGTLAAVARCVATEDDTESETDDGGDDDVEEKAAESDNDGDGDVDDDDGGMATFEVGRMKPRGTPSCECALFDQNSATRRDDESQSRSAGGRRSSESRRASRGAWRTPA
jgi:hypothetical protein